MRHLIVTAHPDDETLYFGGTILQRPDVRWQVVCVTDGNAFGTGGERSAQLRAACEALGVAEVDQWGFPDQPGRRLDVGTLIPLLAGLGDFAAIYTHGPLGDYGHPHHQDVSYAVHQAFAAHPRVLSVAQHVPADELVVLDEACYRRKFAITEAVYGAGLRQMVPLFPFAPVEPYARISTAESQALYGCLAYEAPIDVGVVQQYRHLVPLLEDGSCQAVARRFLGG